MFLSSDGVVPNLAYAVVIHEVEVPPSRRPVHNLERGILKKVGCIQVSWIINASVGPKYVK